MYTTWQKLIVMFVISVTLVMACTDGIHGRNHPQPGGRKETLAATQVITSRAMMSPQDSITYTQAS